MFIDLKEAIKTRLEGDEFLSDVTFLIEDQPETPEALKRTAIDDGVCGVIGIQEIRRDGFFWLITVAIVFAENREKNRSSTGLNLLPEDMAMNGWGRLHDHKPSDIWTPLKVTAMQRHEQNDDWRVLMMETKTRIKAVE